MIINILYYVCKIAKRIEFIFLSNNNNDNNGQQEEMFRGDGLDMFMPYIMVVVSWILHYFQTHQGFIH